MRSRSDDGDGKTRGVKPTRESQLWEVRHCLPAASPKSIRPIARAIAVGWPIAQRGRHVAGAGFRAITGQDGESHESSTEEEVEKDGHEGEELEAAKKACEQDGGDCVEDGNARDALYSLPVPCDGEAVVGEDGEEVGVDAEDDAGAAEFEGVEEAVSYYMLAVSASKTMRVPNDQSGEDVRCEKPQKGACRTTLSEASEHTVVAAEVTDA